MDFAPGLAAGASGAETPFPQLVHDGFAQDRAGAVTGAQEEHVVGLAGADRVGNGSNLRPCSRARRTDRRTFQGRSEEHTSELQSLMRILYDVFCLKKKQMIYYL